MICNANCGTLTPIVYETKTNLYTIEFVVLSELSKIEKKFWWVSFENKKLTVKG